MYLAGQLALTAAQDGLRAGRTYPAVSTPAGPAATARTSSPAPPAPPSPPPTVTAELSDDGAVLQVDVTGDRR